jgi:hypothetical protein
VHDRRDQYRPGDLPKHVRFAAVDIDDPYGTLAGEQATRARVEWTPPTRPRITVIRSLRGDVLGRMHNRGGVIPGQRSRLRATPARKPRKRCGCQAVTFIIAAIVAPAGDCSIASTHACLESRSGFLPATSSVTGRLHRTYRANCQNPHEWGQLDVDARYPCLEIHLSHAIRPPVSGGHFSCLVFSGTVRAASDKARLLATLPIPLCSAI